VRVAVIAYGSKPQDGWQVYKGMNELLEKYPDAEVLVTCTLSDYSEDVFRALLDSKRKFSLFLPEKAKANFRDDANKNVNAEQIAYKVTKTDTPLKHATWELSPGDALAIVDDGTERYVEILEATEDLGLELWDITEGLQELMYDPLEEMGGCDTEAEIIAAVHDLMDALVHHVIHSVADDLTERLGGALSELGMLDLEEDEEEDEED